MKIYAALALLITVHASAGELASMSGEPSREMQEALDSVLRPKVEALPAEIRVEPILESIKVHGRGKRLLLGPLAGKSSVTLRIRITDGDQVTEKIFSDANGAWKGTFKVGQDYAMINRVVDEAAQFVVNYSADRISSPPPKD